MSNDLKRCDSCLGRKKIIGLGGMERDCPACFGVGWLAKTQIDPKTPYNASNSSEVEKKSSHFDVPEVKIKKKPGRKKKVQIDILQVSA